MGPGLGGHGEPSVRLVTETSPLAAAGLVWTSSSVWTVPQKWFFPDSSHWLAPDVGVSPVPSALPAIRCPQTLPADSVSSVTAQQRHQMLSRGVESEQCCHGRVRVERRAYRSPFWAVWWAVSSEKAVSQNSPEVRDGEW